MGRYLGKREGLLRMEKIILPDKIAVEVGENFSPATLTRLLAVLKHR